MGTGGALKSLVGVVVSAIGVELLWLGALAFVLQRFGALALAGVVVLALGGMVAVLDATPLDDRARKR
jgi:hypothetical protein